MIEPAPVSVKLKTEIEMTEKSISALSEVILDEEEQAAARQSKKDLEMGIPKEEVVRVLLWTAPRSLSTAFERCMTRVPKAKIFNEMYGAAFLLGPDRKKRWYPKLTPQHSYKHCKERMEADHPGYDFVFAKDFAFEMHNHVEMLPKGYQHTFLVRHPYKVFTSLRKMICNSVVLRCLSLNAKIKMCFPTDDYFYGDMWKLYKYLRDHPDYPVPIIIDADDLVADPDAMIMKYCEMIGLPFHREILQWEKAELEELPWEGPKFFHFMNRLIGCYKNALNSTGFRKGGFKKDTKKGGTKNAWENKNKNKTSSSNKVDAITTKKTLIIDDTDKVVQNEVTDSATEESEQTSDGLSNDACDAESVSDKDSQKDDKETGASSGESSNKDVAGSTVREYDLSAVHSDVRKAIEYAMPFYKLLHKNRITLN